MHDERETSPATVPLDPRFAAVLVAVARKFSPVIERIGTDLVIFRKTGLIESYIVVVRANDTSDETLAHFIRGKFSHAREVVLVGGESAACRRQLSKLKPWLTRSSVGVAHVADDGTVWTSRARSVASALSHGEADAEVTANDLQFLLEESEKARDDNVEREGDVATFVVGLRKQQPWATYALLVAIGSFFGLEAFFGGVESIPVLARMGAHVHDRMVDDNEWWRAFSVALLHRGFPHLLFNLYVLYVLGTFTERLLGASRFLLLFLLAVLGGSAATFFREGALISVGASGALWGILVAQGILAWWGRGILPDAMIGPARRAATFNLVANVAASTLPSVDWAAHLGGGIAGAVLIGTGALTWGLPRNASERERGVITPAALKAVAGVLVVTFVAAGATALVVGRPWELRNNAVTTYAIDEVNLVVQLPASLSAPPKALVTDTPVERAVVFGDGLLDGVFGGVSVFPRTADESTEAQVATVQEALKGRKKQNAVSSTAVETLKLGEKTGVERTWTFPNGLEFTEAWILGDDHLVRVDAFMWPSLASTTAMEIANRVRVVAPQ